MRPPGEEYASAIRATGGKAIFIRTDVAALVEATVRDYGGLDVLVNCAGIDVMGTVVDAEPVRWQRVIDVNLASVYRTCRFSIPQMSRRGGGAIVSIASLQGMYGWPRYAAYAAAKAGVVGLTRQIAVDYAEEGIRTNAISPGGVATQMVENSARLEPEFAVDPSGHHAPGLLPTKLGEHPELPRLRRPARPLDVAYAALYLACDESAYVSGHNLVVDGGLSARVGGS